MNDDELAFVGNPVDLAGLGIQRLLACDVRSRSYGRAARVWQRIATSVGALAAVVASLAAISFVQDVGWLAISLSIAVAVLVPLQNSLGASSRADANRAAATTFEVLANDYERYIQLDCGPLMSQREHQYYDILRTKLVSLDDRLSKALAEVPRVKFWDLEIRRTEYRVQHLVDYLQMEDYVIPPRAVWYN